ncbi:hypothetical protein BGW41_006303 [Actinomortierella wolfii]|nr:hypothetical protein BGW41_006303 [Actinomortierella wolfii]
MLPSKVQTGTSTLTLFKAFLVLFLVVGVVLAQDPPFNPQPGPGAFPQPTSDGSNIRKNDKERNGHSSATATAAVLGGGSGSISSGSVVTTVTVIDGTTSTYTMGPTATVPAMVNEVTRTPTISKAVQSVLVIASTTYGKPLPAAGPVDDQMESHFWDKFKPRPVTGGGGLSKGRNDRISSLLITQMFAMSLVAAVLTIDML